MEIIRILQNIYEELYVARKPLANFLEECLPALSSQWKKECVENVNTKTFLSLTFTICFKFYWTNKTGIT